MHRSSVPEGATRGSTPDLQPGRKRNSGKLSKTSMLLLLALWEVPGTGTGIIIPLVE